MGGRRIPTATVSHWEGPQEISTCPMEDLGGTTGSGAIASLEFGAA